MIPAESPADRIQKALDLLETASFCWKSGDANALDQCTNTLEESVVELRAVQAAALAQPELLRPSVTVLSQMKIRTAAMERVADIMASFLRPTGEAADDSPLYRAGGMTMDNVDPVAAGVEA